MKKLLNLVILTTITTSLFAQNLSKQFLLENFFEKVEKVDENHFTINVEQHSIVFELIDTNFNVLSYVNPHETKYTIKPIKSTSNSAKKTPEIISQVKRIDSTYIHGIVDEKVNEFFDFYSKNQDINYFSLTSQNQIIESLNFTKDNLNKSANLQIAGVITSLAGSLVGTLLIANTKTNPNIGYGVLGGSIVIGGVLNLASIGAKKQAGQNKLKPIEF